MHFKVHCQNCVIFIIRQHLYATHGLIAACDVHDHTKLHFFIRECLFSQIVMFILCLWQLISWVHYNLRVYLTFFTHLSHRKRVVLCVISASMSSGSELSSMQVVNAWISPLKTIYMNYFMHSPGCCRNTFCSASQIHAHTISSLLYITVWIQ